MSAASDDVPEKVGGKAVSRAQAAGNRGEAETAKYLRKNGYTLLASQWRCRFGELDLIAKDKQGTICFVEVKLRGPDAIALPREFVDVRKQARLRTAASAWLSMHEIDAPARFDVAEVYEDKNGMIRVEYLEDAFS